MLFYKCPICEGIFKFDALPEGTILKDLEECTFDCPSCESTLIVEDSTVKSLCDVLRRRCELPRGF